MANPEHVKILEKGIEVWNKWRAKNPDVRPDLSKFDLRGYNLRRANLNEAYLSYADISYTSLSDSNLNKANLNGIKAIETDFIYAFSNGANFNNSNLSLAVFCGAELIRADFSYCNLNRTDFARANLYRANFNKSDFNKTILRGSYIGNSSLCNLDLSQAKNLETVIHKRPSSIGLDTIYKSGGNIPDTFLRGCGVPESFISYLKDRVGFAKPVDFHSCFISYSHKDKSFAKRLHNDLQERGIRCWLDEHQILPGDDLYDQIDRGIRIWDKVILCCSKNSLNSGWVEDELDKAIQKEKMLRKERQKKILALIPLDLDGYVLRGWESGKKSVITSRMIADFKGLEKEKKKYEAQFEKLVKALQTDDSGREEEPVGKL